MIEQVYMPSETIFREGDESRLCYVIESGHVELLNRHPDGPMTIAMLAERPRDSIKYIRTLFERLRNMKVRVIEQDRRAARSIPETTRFVVTIKPETKDSSRAVPNDGIEMRTFPFRVGRASEDESDDLLDINDLSLEDGEPYTVSRTHFSID